MAETKVTNSDLFAKDAISKTTSDVKSLIIEFEKLEKVIIETAKAQKKQLKKPNNKSVRGLEKQRQAIENINIAERASEKIKKQKLALEVRLKAANSDKIQGNVLLNEQLKQQNRINRQTVTENNKIFGSYKNLSTRLIRLRKEYKDLAAAEKQNTAEGKRLISTIRTLDSRLKKIDKTVGQSQRNVGNYTSAWGKLGNTIKRGLGAAGIIGGVQLITRALRDSFNRIKQFDKELTNIAAISGLTRKELKGLESTILAVSGASIKTSNEVAQLATVLFTLGKTEQEVKLLIKPINDLSIALGSTSEETADFLGQTLNAFGKGAESGQEFADIIANVRKSTSLNFQRIKDALGFVAPTANALNLTLGRTSALIGVLQDNGIKSARAGRLLSTSFLRLASDGKSLGDALDEINEAQDTGVDRLKILEIASESFGKESAALALILANNRDRVDELANSFDNLSEGSLKDLTDTQLESLDAKIKILDSTFERFLLRIENGEGSIGSFFKSFVVGLTELIDIADMASDPFGFAAAKATRITQGIVNKTTADSIKEFNLFLKVTNKLNESEKERIKTINRFLSVDKFRLKDLELRRKLYGKLSDDEIRQELILKTRIKSITALTEVQDENTESQDENTESIENNSNKLKKLGLIDKEQITELKKLKTELNQINEARERLVTGTSREEIDAFNGLSEQAIQLQRIIDVYERLLKGEGSGDGGKIKKGPLSNKDLRDAYAKEVNERVKQEEEAVERLQGLISDSLRTVGQLVDDLFIVKINDLNNKLLATQRRTDQLINKAESSRLGAEESIAFEQKREAELERKRLKEQQKQQRAQALFTVLDSYQSNINSGSQSPLSDTVRDIGILRALAQSFGGSAFDGVDDTGGKGDVDNKGGKTWILHPREQVWSEKNRSEVGYKSREEIIDIVRNSEKNGLISSDVLKESQSKTTPSRSIVINNDSVVREIKGLNNSIRELNKDRDLVEVDSLRNLLKHTKKRGNRKIVTKSKLHK